MNSALHVQKDNTKFFFLSLGSSILLLAGAGFFLTSMLTGDRGTLDAATRACLASMRTNGFNPTSQDNNKTVSVNQATTTNLEAQVYKSGVILAHCPSYELTEYCAGKACKLPGVSFKLEHK